MCSANHFRTNCGDSGDPTFTRKSARDLANLMFKNFLEKKIWTENFRLANFTNLKKFSKKQGLTIKYLVLSKLKSELRSTLRISNKHFATLYLFSDVYAVMFSSLLVVRKCTQLTRLSASCCFLQLNSGCRVNDLTKNLTFVPSPVVSKLCVWLLNQRNAFGLTNSGCIPKSNYTSCCYGRSFFIIQSISVLNLTAFTGLT